jgi:PleD family two-component response regulator
VDLEKVLDKLSKKERELITNADKALYEAKRAG